MIGKKIFITGILVLLVGMGTTLMVSTAFAEEESYEPNNGKSSGKGFTYGFKIMVDGEYYYFAGPPISQGSSVTDVPGHYWVQAGNKVVGKHFNTGPFGASSWWSSDAGDGAYLFKVDGIIDTWSMANAKDYAKKGFVHYHELVSVDDGDEHPTKVLWLKHTAVASFTFDPPMAPMGRTVTPGVDYNFMPNGMMHYSP